MRLIIPLIILMLVSACASGPATSQEGLVIVTSIHPLAEFATAVAGDRATVSSLLPPGAEPHTWQPSASDILMMEKADLVLLVGAEFEPWAHDILESLSSQPTILYLADDAELIENEEGAHEHGDEHDEHGYMQGHDEHDDEHGDEHGEHTDEHGAGHSFEWAGVFELDEGDYTWTFTKVNGEYADPAMKMVILETDDADAHGITEVEELAEELMATSEEKTSGSTLVPASMAYQLSFDENADVSSFTVTIEKKGNYVFFTEHMPFEFEADEHFFKDVRRTNVEPLAEEPESGHDHAHAHDDHEEDGHDGHEHHNHAIDPHVWLDFPTDVAFIARLVETLKGFDPEAGNTFALNGAAYSERLKTLHTDYETRLEGCSPDVVVNHAAFGYLARNYGLEQHAIHGLSPEDEPTPKELADIAELVEEHDVTTIFAEVLVSPKVAETLSAETGTQVLTLNPTPVLTQEQIDKGETFIDAMYENLEALEEGLCTEL
jgi:zinc transport system substrate-binding protein